MSNIERVENLKQLVAKVEPDFNQLAKVHGVAMTFARECAFALQILKDNDYLMSRALKNQDSLKFAILNVAAVGLTLNPVEKLAYLVPRGDGVCFDPSYRGLTKLATDAGSILWAVAEIVCEKDKFEKRGFSEPPVHEFDPFDNGGKIKGAYCVAKTPHGDYLTTTMSIDEIYAIRDRYSESFKSGKKSPWKTDETEMIKKTVIRRAFKSWPMSKADPRIAKALELIGEDDVIEAQPISTTEEPKDHRAESFIEIREMLKELNRTEEKYIEHLTRACRRQIKKLDDLTDSEISQQMVMLSGWVDTHRKNKKGQNENAS